MRDNPAFVIRVPMTDAQAFFQRLNHDYLAVHKAKEELFWATYMGTSDDQVGFTAAESAYRDFISDAGRLAATRVHLTAVEGQPASAERDALIHGLHGWLGLFEANIIDNEQGRALMRELIEAEAVLFAARKEFKPEHINEAGERESASLTMLSTNAATNPDEQSRRSSYEAFQAIERWVLENGFLDIVRLRNRFALALGFDNYFEFKLHKNERMSSGQLFTILDDFLERTDAANRRALQALSGKRGIAAMEPWNLRYHSSGDVVRRMDPYMPFGPALRRWIETFRRLGIQYRGATLQLDLLERPGKFENGFCHGPLPAWFDERGQWVPGQINFTAQAKPDQVGSGLRAITTLFHEGGHAAHFANVTQNSPCFSQEFAPTSMAYAETQSMFCDSLLSDADWLKRYALDAAGEVMPDELIHARIASTQPMRAFDERAIAVVPYFEAALYKLGDADLHAQGVLALARATERRVQGVTRAPRPLLAIPHLLNQESAAAYQGYLLAHMAVYQTRAYFVRKDGYLTDNPAIGPALAKHYWGPGNSIGHDATLRSLTGEGFSARYLADACNQSVEEAWADGQASMVAAAERGEPVNANAQLDATVRVVHGTDVLTDSSAGEAAMCDQFEAWVNKTYFGASA